MIYFTLILFPYFYVLIYLFIYFSFYFPFYFSCICIYRRGNDPVRKRLISSLSWNNIVTWSVFNCKINCLPSLIIGVYRSMSIETVLMCIFLVMYSLVCFYKYILHSLSFIYKFWAHEYISVILQSRLMTKKFYILYPKLSDRWIPMLRFDK